MQNLMALRFANVLFEPLWNNAHIDHVQITVAETLGVEGRGGYYEEVGRDARHGAEPYAAIRLSRRDGAAILARSGLAARREAQSAEIAPADRRDQRLERSPCAANIAPALPTAARFPATCRTSARTHSDTETFVALKFGVANWRWAGVPFYLRTGKRLPQRFSEIVVGFRRVPHVIFPSIPTAFPPIAW